MSLILAGDIGGTNTRLGLFELELGRLKSLVTETYPSLGYSSLDRIVEQFVSEHSIVALDSACFGVAGPVIKGSVATTNLAWFIDARSLARQLGVESVGLINDLEAIGYGISRLDPQDLVTLNAGPTDSEGNLAIIAAGTGLGEAACVWDGMRHLPYACEGGHTDFGPRNELEMALLRHLLGKFQRVSYERVLSGSGLVEIYLFLVRSGHVAESESLTEALLRQAHPGPILNAGLEGRSERCSMAIDLFVSLLGAEAGNLALKAMARGGILLAGGIAPRILDRLKQRVFLEAFMAKGRMRPLLEAMPIHVIMNDKAGLLGAASFAALPYSNHI